jgi:ABC-type branched-subunit amino acid transport system substrate-binding protein
MNKPLRSRIDSHRAIAAFVRWRVLWPTIMLPLMVGLVACGGGGGGGNGPGPKQLNLVIGNSLPLSGASKTLGRSGRKASQLALARIEQAVASQHADHRVQIVNADQGSGPDSAVAAAKQLVDGNGASCLVGPWTSEAVEKTANEVAVPSKVLEISPVAAGGDVAELNDHDLVDSTAVPISVEGEALATAIARDLGAAAGNTVNVATGAGADSNTIAHDFTETWQDDDGTVGRQIVLPADLSLLTSNNPGAVLLADDPAGFAQLAHSLSPSNGWNAAIAWGTDQLASPGLPTEVGMDAVEGMRVLAPGTPSGAQATSAFDGAFESAPPRTVKPAPYAAQEFDATILCYLAAVAAGSTDGQKMADELIDITAPGGTEYSWQQLPGAIRALEDGEDIDYTGASGPLDMDVHGNPTNGVFDVYRYSSGGLELVGEVPVEKPNPATP